MPDTTDPFYEFFNRYAPPMPREQETHSLGSGFFISEDGYILTNAHVVSSADGITVRLTDKREFKAKVIGVDKRTDVALIKIEASGLPKVAQGDSNALKVGEWVVAIGSPFGFDSSVTAGIVSAKGRSLPQENYVPFIQTDVAINPGNSGGPLFNMKGEVVGINSQIYTRSGGSMGLSFAIPIDVAMDVAHQLRTTGRVARGRLGIGVQELTRDLADSFGLSKPGGALVTSVEKGAAADKAGLLPSDVVVKFDGKPVGSPADLFRMVAATHPGAKVTLQVWRKGENKDIQLTMGEIPGSSAVAQGGAKPGSSRPDQADGAGRLGLVLSELTADQKTELRLKGGLVVVEVGSNATRGELRPGDIILGMGNIEVRSLEQFDDILKQVPKGRNVALLVRRNDSVSYIALRLDDK